MNARQWMEVTAVVAALGVVGSAGANDTPSHRSLNVRHRRIRTFPMTRTDSAALFVRQATYARPSPRARRAHSTGYNPSPSEQTFHSDTCASVAIYCRTI